MLRKTLLNAVALVLLGTTAWAQTPKVEFTGFIGYTISDGVSGEPVKALNGQTDAVEPQDSVNFGFSLGFFLSPSAELGFMWRRQATKLDVLGTRTDTLGDLNIDGYHGYGAYNFGEPAAKDRPSSWAASAPPTTAVSSTRGPRDNARHRGRHPVLDNLGRAP